MLHENEFIEAHLSVSRKETEKLQAKAKAELKRLDERSVEISRIIRKLYEDNVNGRITDERFDSLAKSYEDEQKEIDGRKRELRQSIADVKGTQENLSKFIQIVRSYSEFNTLTSEILNSFVEKIIISETEVDEGRKTQEIKIIYKFVGAIYIPEY